MIFIQHDSPLGTEKIIIEEDEKSIWAYLVDNNGNLIQDGFLCSTGALVETKEQVKQAIDKGLAPPLLKNYQNDFSIQKNLTEADFRIDWVSENEISISIKGTPFLHIVKNKNISNSLAIGDDGPYGKRIF